MKTRTIYLAVAGVNDSSFRTLAEAKKWLDKTDPETVGCFNMEDGGTVDGVKTVIVRHTDDVANADLDNDPDGQEVVEDSPGHQNGDPIDPDYYCECGTPWNQHEAKP